MGKKGSKLIYTKLEAAGCTSGVIRSKSIRVNQFDLFHVSLIASM